MITISRVRSFSRMEVPVNKYHACCSWLAQILRIFITAWFAYCDLRNNCPDHVLDCWDHHVMIPATIHNSLHWSRGFITFKTYGWSGNVTDSVNQGISLLSYIRREGGSLHGRPLLWGWALRLVERLHVGGWGLWSAKYLHLSSSSGWMTRVEVVLGMCSDVLLRLR